MRPRSWRLLLALLVTAAWMLASSCGRTHRTIRIATGTRGGTFLPLGETLARSFARDVGDVDFVALESPGGRASIEMIERGEADLALLSNHVEGSSALRLIAPLYQETLQIVVRREASIASVTDLRGHAVSTGPEGSGTESIAHAVLGHFGIAPSALRAEHLTMTEAQNALETGRIDAAFLVAGMRTPAVDALLGRPDMALLSLGEPGRVGSALEGIRIDAPFFIVSAIPERAYGAQPETAVGTLDVEALLVCSERLDAELVYALTESLFAHKAELVQEQRLLASLDEHFDLSVSPYALHDGADQYLRRHEPSLLQRYTDQISLGITVAALVWSSVSAFYAARSRRRKNRIEVRYQEAMAIAKRLRGATGEARQAEIAALHALHDTVLADLADERLDANEGFTVLQRYLDTQLRHASASTPADGDTSSTLDPPA
ncbi:MAG: TAXI family TRAP transporter solute-binding subunit [Sandaracinaceae bacterium]|nr:TAXI family TRAP transporter solute-binding subunit [Sandaracinaceae bacterium]